VITLRSGWGWVELAGEPALALPVPPGALGRAWAGLLDRWNAAGRPPPDEPIAAVLAHARDALVGERYLAPRRPLASRVALSSRAIPARARLLLHALAAPPTRVGALSGAAGPAWPDDATADHVRGLLSCRPLACGPSDPAFALSFDLDTPASHSAALAMGERLASDGHRATFFVVGADVSRATRATSRLRAMGHEIGIHGWVHDFRLAYLRGRAQRAVLARIAGAARAVGARSFRAPALLSSPALRRGLAPIFELDSTLPTTDRDSLLAPRRGCGARTPFTLDGLLQIPVSAPLDDRLLLAGWSFDEVLGLWDSLVQTSITTRTWRVIACHLEPHLAGRRDRLDALLRWVARAELPRSRTLAELAESAGPPGAAAQRPLPSQ